MRDTVPSKDDEGCMCGASHTLNLRLYVSWLSHKHQLLHHIQTTTTLTITSRIHAQTATSHITMPPVFRKKDLFYLLPLYVVYVTTLAMYSLMQGLASLFTKLPWTRSQQEVSSAVYQ